jgi:hypothetical protein
MAEWNDSSEEVPAGDLVVMIRRNGNAFRGRYDSKKKLFISDAGLKFPAGNSIYWRDVARAGSNSHRDDY